MLRPPPDSSTPRKHHVMKIAPLLRLASVLPLLALALLLPGDAFAQRGATVTVTVTNIPGAQGDLLVALYDSAETFTKDPAVDRKKVPVTSTNDITVRFTGVRPGRYAIAVIQDLNGNGKLDTNLFGMPKEPLAFSVIEEIPRGRPSFEQCAFDVAGSNVSMRIALTVE